MSEFQLRLHICAHYLLELTFFGLKVREVKDEALLYLA